ncbi:MULTISPECIES: SulP family inorganic anion transporter [Pelosinus]|uniref:Sulfate transporter n=1 Tax=Pelosinus fermentans B4 TaxID=1149862 RepID=I8RKC6_9FIRM|nr:MULTISPECIES: SulP family inorganic anion transporter [Pelosinus]EIW20628.1 sulfate transporter [Pelosinus fermentans B4]EIW25657.1 sulfate transporter [Pelosinus fermentans A11]OAM93380.1 sulfate transporter [Pelosinus fermentans DSM 17108]SDQ75769.1 sulfate permease, SulP family [Pelosinus fermentans]
MTRAIRIPLKRYFTRFFKKDLLAGLTVGVISLPLAMAFAIASGANPENGIYTTIIAACLVALFGGSRYQVAGPTGAFIPILLSIVLTYGFENLLIAGFLSGIILVVMGLLDMGSLIKFIPRSVTIGFTAGIAVNIFAGQISNFFGLTGLERHESFLSNMQEIITHFDTINPYSTLTAVICLAVILITPRFLPKVPGSLVGLILSTMTATLFFPNDVITIASAFGGIPSDLPHMQFPDITLEKVQLLLQPALTIAILGAIESLLSAVVADGLTGTQHNSNRELLGQGIANIVIPLFGGIPATGAIARTATNIKSGAATRYSVIISAIFVLLTMLALAPYAGLIPLASMAPVLMVVSYNMSQHQAFISIAKVKSLSTGVLLITFFLTVFANLTVAVEIGLLLTMMLFIKRMSEIMVVTQVIPDHENHLIDIADQNALHTYDCSQISIFSIEGPLFFGAAQMFSESIMSTIHYDPKIIILRMSRVPIMDITGENHLRMIVENIQKKGITVLISGLNEQPEKKMKKTGLYDQIGQDRFFPHTNHAIAYALEQINKNHCNTCQKINGNECVLDRK